MIPMGYRKIAADLQDRIGRGEHPPGTKLPTYAELAALYSASVSTVQRAVMLPQAQGVIVGGRVPASTCRRNREERGRPVHRYQDRRTAPPYCPPCDRPQLPSAAESPARGRPPDAHHAQRVAAWRPAAPSATVAL